MDGSRSVLAGVSVVVALVALALSLLVLLAPAHPNVSLPLTGQGSIGGAQPFLRPAAGGSAGGPAILTPAR